MKQLLNSRFFHPFQLLNKCLFSLLIAIVYLCSCNHLSAQTDEGQSGEDLGWVVPQDNGLNFSTPAVPTIVRYAVARYQSSAQVFLVVKSPLGLANVPISYRRTDQPSLFTNVNITTTATGGTITGLPLDKDFEIFATNVNGLSQKIAQINTKKEDSEMIMLHANVYGPISGWLKNPQGVDLYTFVAGLPGVHFIEKSHFIQEFFYGGKPLNNTEIGRVPDMPPTTDNGGCLCRPLQLSVADLPIPSGDATSMDEFGNGEYNADALLAEGGATTTQFGNGKGKKWYAYAHIGAAKYQQVWIETRKCVGGWNSMKMDDTGPGPQNVSGNTATLSYSFVCVGVENFQPSDCPCERPRSVDVSWKYAAETYVDANLRSGGCFNGRGTTGMAVDVAAVMYGYSDMGPNDLPLPLAAGIAGTGVGCSTNFDEGALVGNLAATVLYGLKSIKSFSGDPIDALWGLYYTPKA